MCQSSVGDIISNLPKDAIDNILARLPLREAARTCILARRWRYMWANLPYLRVDDTTFREMKKKTQDGLLIAIFEVLLLKRVPIVKLDLNLCELESSRHLDLLLSFVSRNCGLQELTLLIVEGVEDYKLPPSLFSCLELTHLTLWNCVIEPPTQFKGFNRLVSLDLLQCPVLPDVVSDIISSSPLLEVLNVELLNGLIQLSAPNLRVLFFTSCGCASISFKYVPRLSSCVLTFSYDSPLAGESSNALQSFCNLVAVEDLKIGFTINWLGQDKSEVRNTSLPRKLTTSLNNLKSLNLTGISFHGLYEVSLVLCLIRSSPNLTKLVVDTKFGFGGKACAADLEQITHLLEVQEWSETCLNSLREAEVCGVTNKAPDLGFVKLLLAISPKLETMIVIPDFQMSLEERLEISAKMLHFRGPTPLAEIIFHGSNALPSIATEFDQYF